MKGQEIRPSLFQFTYGVGSIVESPSGPMVIPSFERWGNIFSKSDALQSIEKFEIHDPRASAVLSNARFFRLPTNVDFKKSSDWILFQAIPFPRWGLCMKENHHKLFRINSDGSTRCPNCRTHENARRQAIRFVLSCSKGHMTDLDWSWAIHGSNSNCTNDILDWTESGNSLSEILISCSSCGAKKSLADIYRTRFKCSGFYQESGKIEDCDRDARIVLRNASYLHVPENISFLTIPPMSTNLHLILGRSSITAALGTLKFSTKLDPVAIRTTLRHLQNTYKSIGEQALIEIDNVTDEDLMNATNDVLEVGTSAETINDSIVQELKALKLAAERGAPPDPTNQRPTLEVEKGSSLEFTFSETIRLRVTPVKRLRVVTIQTGYRRLISDDSEGPKFVPTAFGDKDKWFLSLEMMGEGIFIDLPPDIELNLMPSETYQSWLESWKQNNQDLNRYKFHPEFIWLHTLSHRLISSLGIDSGYSSAGIRERVYFHNQSGKNEGGILLYVSQRGADGTLGGMIALVPNFKRILDSAVANIEFCSNDPLCRERRHQLGTKLGAACFGCLLVSETSCEHQNLFLDRNLLVESL